MVHNRPHSSNCKHIPAYFFKLILSSKYLICVLFNVYLNKKEMNNFYKFGQNALSNYQI